HRRYDLILSDTYRGPVNKGGDAAVLEMVEVYRQGRFCPLVVFSASAKTAALKDSPFVKWADKTTTCGIEKAISAILETGIPQAARALHDDIDQSAGSSLWDFLDTHWNKLTASGFAGAEDITRLVRRRAAFQLADMVRTPTGFKRLS